MSNTPSTTNRRTGNSTAATTGESGLSVRSGPSLFVVDTNNGRITRAQSQLTRTITLTKEMFAPDAPLGPVAARIRGTQVFNRLGPDGNRDGWELSGEIRTGIEPVRGSRGRALERLHSMRVTARSPDGREVHTYSRDFQGAVQSNRLDGLNPRPADFTAPLPGHSYTVTVDGRLTNQGGHSNTRGINLPSRNQPIALATLAAPAQAALDAVGRIEQISQLPAAIQSAFPAAFRALQPAGARAPRIGG
jgi:hypothetical protein